MNALKCDKHEKTVVEVPLENENNFTKVVHNIFEQK
jgi:hypothetical protein